MMHLCWFTLLLCLSASAENNAMWRESGENVTMECSSAGCSSRIKRYDGMHLYLYQDHKEPKEVLYYHPYPGSTDKITLGMRYTDRIRTNGSLEHHTITISKLTVDDSGFYRCVYLNFPDREVCGVSTLFIRGVAPCFRSTEAPLAPANENSPHLVLTIFATCTISMLVTIISILLIMRVKRWTSSRRITTSAPQVSNDNVYEVMTKISLHPQQSSSNLCGID